MIALLYQAVPQVGAGEWWLAGVLAGVIVVLGQVLLSVVRSRRENGSSGSLLRTLERIDQSLSATLAGQAQLTMLVTELRREIEASRAAVVKAIEDLEREVRKRSA